MARFVLDCSVTIAWLLEENAASVHLLEDVERSQPVVPVVWLLEVANVLLVGERRQRITQDQSRRFIEALKELPVTIDRRSEIIGIGELISMARPHQLTAYDATYLELALRLRLPLCTHDKGLASAARSVGVVVTLDPASE